MSKRDILYLNDSDQVPFGKLSPLYLSKLRIGQEEASNVISYVYSGLVKIGSVRNDLLKESGKDSRVTSLKLFREEKDNIYKNALEEGLLNRVRQNDAAQQLLIESGNGTIIYESENTYLGANSAGGLNTVGNLLMKIRKIVIKDSLEKKKERLKYILEKNVYNSNIVYNTLENLIKSGVDNLYRFLDKSVDDIILMLKLPPFPGTFNKSINPKLEKYVRSKDGKIFTRQMAKDLRKIYAEQFNEAALELQKKDILHTFLIKQALKSFPSDRNYNELYKRYKQLKESDDLFSEEYNQLSKLFRNQINDIRDFIIKLSDTGSLKEFEDRVYYLASKGVVDIVINSIDTLPVEKVSEEEFKEYINKTDKLADKIRKYEEERKDMNDIIEEIESWNDESLRLLKLERYYMRKAKEEVAKKEGVDLRDISGSEEATSIDELWEFYQKNYPGLFYDILKAKQQTEKEIYIEQKLDEYMENNPNSSVYWAKADGEYLYGVYDILMKWAKNSSEKELPSLIKSIKDLETDQTQKMFKVTDFSPLSPYFVDLIEIENFIFPNVMYYISYKLFQSIADPILKEEKEDINRSVWSHNMLMLSARGEGYSRNPLDYKLERDLVSLYNYMEGIFIQTVLKNRAYKALYTKFKDSEDSQLSKLLISSSPSILIYNDNNDSILGSGPILQGKFQGMNMIGNIMTQIRDEMTDKYGKVLVEDVEVSPKKIIIKEKDFILSDYMYEKTRELLYVFMIYSLYIKNNRIITIDNTKFIIDKIYKKTYDNLKKIEKKVKIPRINSSFQKQSDEFLEQNNFKINRDALNKLWSYIYILNEMMNFEIIEENIPLFKKRMLDKIDIPIGYDEIKDFVSNIEYEPKQWFIETVEKKIKDYGTNICVGIGLTYVSENDITRVQNDKRKKSEIVCKNINKEKIEQNYLQLLLPLLSKIKDNVKYQTFYITIYSSNINLLRAEYVKNLKYKCPNLVKKSTDESIDTNCVLDTYIKILTKLKDNNDISTITGNSITFVNSLLSTFGSQPIILKNLKIAPSPVEDLNINSVLLNILTSKVDLTLNDKYEGVYEFDPSLNVMSGDLGNIVPIDNTKMFVCKIMAKLVRKDRQLVETYTIKYKQGERSSDNRMERPGLNLPRTQKPAIRPLGLKKESESDTTFEVSSKGDDIGIQFYLDEDNDKIVYTLPSDIYFDMTSFVIRYQVVSDIKSVNLLSNFNLLSRTTDSMARVLSFSDYYEDISKVETDEKEEKDEEFVDNLAKKAKDFVQKKKRDDEEEDEGLSEEEEEGVSEEEVEEHIQYEGEPEDEEEEEEEEEEYYEEDQE